MQEATLRPRQHGAAADPRLAAGLASSRAAEAKRRRANVLFLLVLTTVCAGFLAATTDSKAMVYLFAVSMVALGGYVYLLVTINQQQLGERAPRLAVAPRRRARRAAPRRRYADDDDDEYWEPSAGPAPAATASAAPCSTRREAYADLPGSGTVRADLLRSRRHRASGSSRAIRAIRTAARPTAGTRPLARRRAGRRHATAATPPVRSRCSARAVPAVGRLLHHAG